MTKGVPVIQNEASCKSTQELMEEFQNEYLQNGWRLITGICKSVIVMTLILSLLFLNPDNPFYWRVLYSYPIYYLMMYFIDKVYCTNKKLAELLLMINILVAGLIIIRENLCQKSYSFNENWMCYILYCKYIGYFFFLKPNRIITCFYFIMLTYIIAVNIYYDDVPFSLYASIVSSCILFPMTLTFTCQKIKEMIVLLQTKKDLIHTIRSILQVFPEGVIIRSVDPVTKQTVIKFANDVASQFLRQQDDKTEVLERIKVKPDSPVQSHEDQQLIEFLQEQELKIDTEQFTSASQMVELKECKQQIEEVKQLVSDISREDSEGESTKLEHYNIKSIKVQWDNCNSFMHVFVNTTQVKKLEEERASRDCQLSMFTSLSHDMRTPLNAISNSLHLSNFIVNEMKDKIAHMQKASTLCQPLFVRFERFIKIGEISSLLLLNLIEDILDLAKFRAKMFKLVMSEFKLTSLLTEIDFLFGFQCVERNLQFKIVCNSDLADTTFVADHKRIKQVLINLISNSVKFTERGSITVIVSKFESENELYLEFTVKDTGVGINQNDIPKLFSKFGMLQKHLKMNACGSGIGLSISKMIVESLGGNITIESEEDQWTEFKFTIKCSENLMYDNIEEHKESFTNNNLIKSSDNFKNLKLKLNSFDESGCNIQESSKAINASYIPESTICNIPASKALFNTKTKNQ